MKITPEPLEDDIEYVSFGDAFSLPSRFSALLEPEDAGETDFPSCRLEIVVEDGRPVCVGFSCERAAGARPISGTVLRTLPIASWIRETTRRVAGLRIVGQGPFWLQEPDGTRTQVLVEPTVDDAHHLPAALQHHAGLASRLSGPQRAARRGIPLTDDDLREVARVYREAVPLGAPTQAVANRMHVARSTAGRWVMQARARGFLGAATGRSGGETAG